MEQGWALRVRKFKSKGEKRLLFSGFGLENLLFDIWLVLGTQERKYIKFGGLFF